MNNIVEQFRRDNERVLDQLVDGELSADQRRALLAALDDEPGGWRRCALAFVESQTWREQLAPRSIQPVAAVSAGGPHPAARGGRFWAACLATAAALLIAFGLGTRFPSARSTVLAEKPSTDEPAPGVAERARESASESAAESQIADDGADVLDNPASPRETIKLALGDDGEEIDLPLIDGADETQTSPTESESATAQGLMDQLRRAGLQVTRYERFYPVELTDGRQVVVPVEELEIHSPSSIQF